MKKLLKKKQSKKQIVPINPVCSECKFPIVRLQNFLVNDKDGTILCKECFIKLQKEGKIK